MSKRYVNFGLFSFLVIFICILAFTLQNAFSVENTNSSNSASIVFTNDVHGHLDNSIENTGLCYASAAQIKDDEIAKGNDTILVDAGDHTSGSVYSNNSLGLDIIDLMKMSNYDFAVPGNHEFDQGINMFYTYVERAKKMIEDSSFNYYATNFYHIKDGQKTDNVLDSYKVFNLSGKKIALIGIMTPDTISLSAPGYFQDDNGNWIYGIDSANDTVNNLYTNVQNTIDNIKNTENVDSIIAVGHLGVLVDEDGNLLPDDQQVANTSVDLIKKIHGLDAFIDGHSHDFINAQILDSKSHPVKLVQTGTNFEKIGKLNFTFNNDNNSLEIGTEFIDSYSRKDSVLAKEADIVNTINETLGDTIATTNTDFIDSYNGQRLVRKQETNLTDFYSDALYWYGKNNYDCDLAIVNGGGVRSTIKSGDVSCKDLFNCFPFLNLFTVSELSGQQILDALEFASRFYGTDIETGGFVHCAGCVYRIDPSIESTVQLDIEGRLWVGPPTGKYRVNSVKIYDSKIGDYVDLDLSKTYKVCGLNYALKNYGDGFMMFKGAKTTILQKSVIDVVWDYARSFSKIKGSSLPLISSTTSPLSSLKNYYINYENLFGSNRINAAYTVEFNSNGGSTVSSQVVDINTCAKQPDIPVKEGFTFDGWYNDADLSLLWDFSTPITKDIVLYAKWTENVPINPDVPENNNGSNINGQEIGSSAQTSDENYILSIVLFFVMIVSAGIVKYCRRDLDKTNN